MSCSTSFGVALSCPPRCCIESKKSLCKSDVHRRRGTLDLTYCRDGPGFLRLVGVLEPMSRKGEEIKRQQDGKKTSGSKMQQSYEEDAKENIGLEKGQEQCKL